MKKLLHALAVVAAFTAPAKALVIEPPVEFVHPFAGTLIIDEKPLLEIDAACRVGIKAPGALNILACAKPRGNVCTIVLPPVGADMIDARIRGALERHELAHCNGWHHKGE